MFENVIGHSDAKQILNNNITTKRVSHAYAFVGPKGVGKRKLAEEFAKFLLKKENLLSAVDYKCIEKIPGKKNILVDQIRKGLIEDIHISPAEGDYKIYIINDAETLNEEAQNALLKTLEEPPHYVCIILITDNIQAFLPTVISRVKQIKFNKLSNKELNDYCIYNNCEDKYTDKMFSYIDGSIGKLISLSNDIEYECFNDSEKIVECFKNKNILQAMKLMEKISLKTTNILDYLQYLLYYEGLYGKVFEVEKAKTKLRYNGNEDIIKTVMIINICK